MKYLAIILVMASAVLFGALGNSQIVFQGTINEADGTPFRGQAKVGIKFVNSLNGDTEIAGLNDNPDERKALLPVENGSYSMVIPLSNQQLDILANLPNTGNYYLQVYVVATTNVNANVFHPDYKLVPNIQMLAAPIAFTSRGIYMNLRTESGNTWRVGETVKSSPMNLPDGMIVGQRVGIGIPTPNAMLTVVSIARTSANSTTLPSSANNVGVDDRAIMVTDGNLIVTGNIYADRVWHVRWQ